MRCSFSFGQLEELLATVHHIAPDRRTAFQGRLKHLQSYGIPTSQKPGKGKAISYSIEHVFRSVLTLELIQAGINPQLAAGIIDSNWASLLTTVYLNGFTGTERVKHGGGSGEDWVWLVRPEALRSLTDIGESEFDRHEAIDAVPASDLSKMLVLDAIGFGPRLGAHWRTLVLNGGALVRGVLFVIENRFEWASRDDMLADLRDAIDERQKLIEAAIAALDLRSAMSDLRSKRGESPKFSYAKEYPHLVGRAIELLTELPPTCADALKSEEGTEVTLDHEALRWLADRRLVEISAEELSVTPLALVVGELLREGENGNP